MIRFVEMLCEGWLAEASIAWSTGALYLLNVLVEFPCAYAYFYRLVHQTVRDYDAVYESSHWVYGVIRKGHHSGGCGLADGPMDSIWYGLLERKTAAV